MSDITYDLKNLSLTAGTHTISTAVRKRGVYSISPVSTGVTWDAPATKVMPQKGDIIKFDALGDGTLKRFRVLKINEDIAEILYMGYDIQGSRYYSSTAVTTQFNNGNIGVKYADSDLDTYMNTTYYNMLASNVKNAIIEKNIDQTMWHIYNNVLVGQVHIGYNYDNERKSFVLSDSVNVGFRKVYAIDLQDIIDYFDSQEIRSVDLANMLWEITARESGLGLFLRTAKHETPDQVYLPTAYWGSPIEIAANFSSAIQQRPAFQINLSKIDFINETLAKGDIIDIDVNGDGVDERFRVLKKVSGNVYELMSLDLLRVQYNSTSQTTTFEGRLVLQNYAQSNLDNYLNSGLYSTFTNNIKSAIIYKNIIQSAYNYFDLGAISDYDFRIQNKLVKRIDQHAIGERNIYALDMDDIVDYFDLKDKAELTNFEVNELIWEKKSVTTDDGSYMNLMSARSNKKENIMTIYGITGEPDYNEYSSYGPIRYCFQIDLTNITYTKE